MIAENLQKINSEIAAAATRAGRNSEEIKLIAVSKRQPASAILEAYAAGHTLFGENYVQELEEKRAILPAAIKFHFIGHLQSNKCKAAVLCSHMIETVDRAKLGDTINKQLRLENRRLDVLIQVNIGHDPNKSGTSAQETADLLDRLTPLSQLRVCGLMTMPPYSNNPENSRPFFHNLRMLAEDLHAQGFFPEMKKPELSMGMSNDFAVAIEEGATIIRVGTAIFGERQ